MLIALITFLQCTMFFLAQVQAHSAVLDVVYDDCTASFDEDGVNEMWYALNYSIGGDSTQSHDVLCYHLPDNVTTLRYYFEDISKDGTYTWETDVSAEVANQIKTAYADSMKKWNNVYFYSRDAQGHVIKKQLINIVEGTEDNHNLSIYPTGADEYIAATGASAGRTVIETGETVHMHYASWEMTVSVKYFYAHGTVTSSDVEIVRERTGAHEIGHVLGLRDIEDQCGAGSNGWHHEEILMGYGDDLSTRSTDISYKDIAGVAITRGFHTDADHKWLVTPKKVDGKNKLICSICNGVKYVADLSGYTYNQYGKCNSNHELSGGNMMAVASYGDKDYYKCKYCRYVAPYSAIVSQDYSLQRYSSEYHEVCNGVTGLQYAYLQEHSRTTAYQWISYTQHGSPCACGEMVTAAHAVLADDFASVGEYARCVVCKGQASVGMIGIGSVNELPHTENGSYQLPNGVIVLVAEDVQSYLNGDLVFYTGEQE